MVYLFQVDKEIALLSLKSIYLMGDQTANGYHLSPTPLALGK